MLFDHPGFREWFRNHHNEELPKEPAMPLGTCEGCASAGVPILARHCLVCLAEGYGQARSEQRIADGIRSFVRALVDEPREVAQNIVGDLLDTFYHAVPDGPDQDETAQADR